MRRLILILLLVLGLLGVSQKHAAVVWYSPPINGTWHASRNNVRAVPLATTTLRLRWGPSPWDLSTTVGGASVTGLAAGEWEMTGLSAATTYYWQVDAQEGSTWYPAENGSGQVTTLPASGELDFSVTADLHYVGDWLSAGRGIGSPANYACGGAGDDIRDHNEMVRKRYAFLRMAKAIKREGITHTLDLGDTTQAHAGPIARCYDPLIGPSVYLSYTGGRGCFSLAEGDGDLDRATPCVLGRMALFARAFGPLGNIIQSLWVYGNHDHWNRYFGSPTAGADGDAANHYIDGVGCVGCGYDVVSAEQHVVFHNPNATNYYPHGNGDPEDGWFSVIDAGQVKMILYSSDPTAQGSGDGDFDPSDCIAADTPRTGCLGSGSGNTGNMPDNPEEYTLGANQLGAMLTAIGAADEKILFLAAHRLGCGTVGGNAYSYSRGAGGMVKRLAYDTGSGLDLDPEVLCWDDGPNTLGDEVADFADDGVLNASAACRPLDQTADMQTDECEQIQEALETYVSRETGIAVILLGHDHFTVIGQKKRPADTGVYYVTAGILAGQPPSWAESPAMYNAYDKNGDGLPDYYSVRSKQTDQLRGSGAVDKTLRGSTNPGWLKVQAQPTGGPAGAPRVILTWMRLGAPTVDVSEDDYWLRNYVNVEDFQCVIEADKSVSCSHP